MWLFVVVLVIALMIPITAILLDSPLGRSLARRLEGQGSGTEGRGSSEVRELERRIDVLETDLQDLTKSVTGMREEIQFVQRLLEDPKKKRT